MSIIESLPPMLWDDDSPRVRKSDPATSHAAADSSNRADSKQAVLSKLAQHGHLAAYELESILPEWSGSRVRTALSELAAEGRVQHAADKTRKTRYGRDAHVWELS